MTTGPAPRIQPLAVGSLGEKNRLYTVSPVPVWLPAPGKTSLWWVIGKIVREKRFQSSLVEMGMTGWMLSVCRSPLLSVPML